jgi:hypothetical protein
VCNFITGVLDAKAETPGFRALVAKHRLRFQLLANPCITPQLKPGERYYHVTNNHCDCSTSLTWRPKELSLDADIRKVRNKGWSETKIERWVKSKGPRTDQQTRGDRLTKEQWLEFLSEALSLREVHYVGLMAHFYRKSTDDEDFTIRGRTTTSVRILREGMKWEENVLYEVRAEGAG